MEVGDSRTGHGALGRVAVRTRAVLSLLTVGLLLSGCKAAPQIAGVLTGGAIGVTTGNPALAFLGGVAVDTATTAGARWYGRSRSNAEQNAIARIAGKLKLGQHHAWHIHHIIPIGDEHGDVYVVRVTDTPVTQCRQIVFSVDSGEGKTQKRAWYIASVCHQAQGWKWADAEPAVARWGYLQ